MASEPRRPSVCQKRTNQSRSRGRRARCQRSTSSMAFTNWSGFADDLPCANRLTRARSNGATSKTKGRSASLDFTFA
jgi:hypothetical protein